MLNYTQIEACTST